MYIQFGECFCKGIQLDDHNVIIVSGIDNHELFLLEKMSDHHGTVTEISFPETAEMVARVHNLIQDGLKYRKIKELMK